MDRAAVLRLRAAARHHLHLPGLEGERRIRPCISAASLATNLFVAGEMMAGNVLGKGYTAGVGMAIGTAFGRIAGTAGGQGRPCRKVRKQEAHATA